jgi:hypothetical protein
VDVGPARRLGERLDDVCRRAELGIPTPQVDERRAGLRSRGRDAAEEGDEVLLREPADPCGAGTHPVIVFVASRLGA